ncbi:MAG TPA: replication initiator, partial [Actinomycetes bacterium]|nr:replication initiator [Actinomycetes bacterium]
ESVAEHPAVFATFTAPSFGPVHALRADRHSRPQFTPGILEEAIRLAVAMTTVPIPATPNDPNPRVARWGSQLDIRHLRSGAPGDLSEQAVAGYIAKYATKSTEGYGPALTRRLTPRDLARLDTAQVRPHIARHVRAAWRLGASPHLARLHLQRWAHQLGFGGHFLTRSRRYSTTFTRLRRARATYRRTRGGGIPLDAFGRPDGDDATVILATWTYAGTGWRTDTTRQLAIDAAARAREHRRATRAKRTSAA